MKRRSFLGLLAASVAAPAVKAEQAETTFTTPEMNFSSDRSFVHSVRIPFAPYEPDMIRFAVRDEEGRLGYILQGPVA
jgi:hypothetical protein